MAPDPFFSVVIPTYNRADFIKFTIESVLDQQFQDFEIIVVDDGSSDETERVVKDISSPKIRYYKKQNGERGAARNTGVDFSRGLYVTFLDSDDILYSNHLAVSHSELTELKFPQIYHQAYELRYLDGRKKKSDVDAGTTINDALFVKGNVLSCMGVFLKCDTARSIPFNEDRELSGVEDWELWIRLAARYPFCHGKTITGALMDHEGRSVIKANRTELVKKMNLLFKYVYQDDAVKNEYSKFRGVLKANINAYISLHLSGNRVDKFVAVKFLVNGFTQSPRVFFRRRTFAILRNLIFSW
ncbi:MAG: glycosyltransferase family A protein [Cyclobacteriaceae bacterium]